MKSNVILLVEDDPEDEFLTLRAFEKGTLANEVVVVRDGVEAMDYLFGTGTYAGRDTAILPELMILDLGLPKKDGLEVLQAIWRDERTKLLPVVVFTSSIESQDMIKSFSLGAISFIRKPLDLKQFTEAVKEIGVNWTLINQQD